jgi:lysophospholipase L1-like esterase
MGVSARRRKYTGSPPIVWALTLALVGLSVPQLVAAQTRAATVVEPIARTDANSQLAHTQLVEKARRGGIDVYFVGDSITRRWGATDYPELLASWTKNFYGWNAANFGWGADTTRNILWRMTNGELDDVHPKVIVLLAGTNDIGAVVPADSNAKVDEVTLGIGAIIEVLREKAPGARIVLMAIFPRNDNIAVMPAIDAVNRRLASFANGETITFIDINDKLADRDGRLFDGVMGDRLHPAIAGYQIWADALKPVLTRLLGPPSSTDHAPPPTGDPSALAR